MFRVFVNARRSVVSACLPKQGGRRRRRRRRRLHRADSRVFVC